MSVHFSGYNSAESILAKYRSHSDSDDTIGWHNEELLDESQTLKLYESARSVSAPQELPRIFVSRHQSDDSLKGLAITYSWKPSFGTRVQLFEVPHRIYDDCQEYCRRGYSPSLKPRAKKWSSKNGWVKLSDKTDFTCREKIAKVFSHEDNHWGLMWGDGTILHKCGTQRCGTTPVYRVIDPEDPFITEVLRYGKVKEVWIKCLDNLAPAPFYRFESSYVWSNNDSADSYKTEFEVCMSCQEYYMDTYTNLKKERDRIRESQEDDDDCKTFS